MAKNEENGVWRTVGGRRIFIKEGQDLATAMVESGKFKNLRSDYRKAKEEMSKKEAPEGEKFRQTLEESKVKTFADEIKEKEEKTKKNEYTSEELKEKYGTDNIDLINAGKEKEDRVSLKLSEKQNEEIKEYFNNEEKRALESKDMSYGYSKKGLESMSNQELDNYIKRQEELVKEYNDKYNQDLTYDQRTTRNRQDTTWDKGMKIKYEQQLKNAQEEKVRRDEEKNKYFGKTEIKETPKAKDGGFVQQTDMYGGTREYSKEQLNKMQENGVKPMEHSYTGGGWEGTKYDSKLTTKDIAKNISDYSKKEFPDVKLSRKTDYNGVDIHVMSSNKDLYASTNDIDKMSDKQVSDTIRNSIGGYTRMDEWLNDNNRKSANGTFTTKDERDYLKSELNTYKNRKGDNVTGNEWYLSDYGKKVVSGLNKEMNSYNYDDSDGMVDYFNTNFYGYVHIGKWDKPYEVSESKSSGNQISSSLQQKAYKKYLKEHPNSKMTFEDFMK